MKRRLSEFGPDLTEHVEPAMVAPLVTGIRNRLPDDAGSPRLAVELHRIVATEVAYDSPEPGFNRPIRETWDRGGNCVDQSVLLLSMVVAAGLEGRLVAVSKSPSTGHMLPEIRLADRAPSETIERLYRHTTPDGVAVTRQFAWETEADEPGPWFVADPVSGEFVGDIAALREDGYVEDTADGWTWTHTEEVTYYEP